jgi:chromosome segregation ATPase
MASTARRAGLAVGGAALAGFGAYYATQAAQVAALEGERRDLETKAFVAKGKALRAESSVQENEALIAALARQREVDTAAALDLAQQLGQARARVQELEQARAQKERDARRCVEDGERAKSALETARGEIARFRDEAAASEKALRALQARVAEARRMLNPLNHPAVRGGGAGGAAGGGGGK